MRGEPLASGPFPASMATRNQLGSLASQDLSAELLSFIEGAIPSVWALELLILMRTEPDRPWPADELVRTLRASDTLVADVLSSFEVSGLVVREGPVFLYRPASRALESLCAELETAYGERPVRVVNAVTRRRSDQLQSFADAFRFRGSKP